MPSLPIEEQYYWKYNDFSIRSGHIEEYKLVAIRAFALNQKLVKYR